MKKAQLVLNIVLSLAVIALFVLHFTSIGSKKTGADLGVTGGSSNSNIYYVQIDSVLSQYDMAKDLSSELEAKYNASMATLKAKQEAYQKDVEDYQYKAQRGLITRAEAEATEKQLYGKQQEFASLQQNLSSEFSEKQATTNRKVIDAIMQYLKKNSAQYKYKYVLGTTFGGNVLYANDSLDITAGIVKGINAEYKESKKK
jgi:outer membrane protein